MLNTAMSIRARLNWVLLVTFVVALGVASALTYFSMRNEVTAEVQTMAELQMATGQAIRRYTSEHVREQLLKDSTQFHPAAVPSFSANTMMGYLREKYPEYSYRELALNPMNPDNLAQGWEADAVRTFRSDEQRTELSTVSGWGISETLRLARPLRATPACLVCHGAPTAAPLTVRARYGIENGYYWKVGEVVGAQVVTINMKVARARVNQAVLRVTWTSLGLFVLFFVGLNVALRRTVIMPIQTTGEAWRRKASQDELTGLPNRRHFTERLEELLAQARSGSKPLAVLALDVDHFKRVNDSLGHAAGDEVLRELGRRLHMSSKRMDVPGRIGGEEFAVILPECSYDDAMAFAEVLRAAIAGTAFEPVGEVTASIGVASWRPGETAAHLLHRADVAMYRAKSDGRNRVRGDALAQAASPQAAAQAAAQPAASGQAEKLPT